MAESLLSILSMPQEVLDLILSHLPLSDTAHLGRCNKRLQTRVQPILFGTPDRVNQAMKWACEQGLNGLVRTAISYGASVNVIPLKDTDAKTFTLHLAAKHRRVDTFNLLIELGARADDPAVRYGTVRTFVKHLSGPLLERFAHAGLVAQLDQDMRDSLLMGVPDYEDESQTLNVVRMLLDSGADPNCVVYRDKTHRETTSPLSAAILSRRWHLFDLLLQNGADIHGVRDPPRLFAPPERPLHVPMLGAALAMATGPEGIDPEPVRRCLDAGADANTAAIAIGRNASVFFVTPLLLYLDAIRSWERGRNGRDAAWGLAYLVEHGALVNTVSTIPPQFADVVHDVPNHEHARYMDQYRVERKPPPAQRLLDKWGVDYLAGAPFLSAIKLLFRHGNLLAEDLGALLARYDDDTPNEATRLAWQDLLATIIAIRSTELDRLLRGYIGAKGTYPGLDIDWRNCGGIIGELARATVRCLVDAGADINARWDGEYRAGETALFSLCEAYAKTEHEHRHPLDLSAYGYSGRHRYPLRLTPSRAAFLRFLVETGADPKLGSKYYPKDWDVCTPAEVFREAWQRLLPEERTLADELFVVFERGDEC